MNPSVLIRTLLRGTGTAENEVRVEMPTVIAYEDLPRAQMDAQEYQYYNGDYGMKQYHYNWLSKYPQLSPYWLKQVLAQGFHIHHMDGNHNNDEPRNLMLIWGQDHLSAHGQRFFPLKGKKRLWYGEVFAIVFIVLAVIMRWW